MKYGYIRISSISQSENFSVESQKEKLREIGIEEENMFVDVFTGTDIDRPSLNNLLKVVKSGDEIYVVRLDRFARNTLQALSLISKLEEQGVSLISLDLPLMADPAVRSLFRSIILFFAEFEQNQRKLRQMEGIEKAKLAGKYNGRRSVITAEMKKRVFTMYYEKRLSKTDIAKVLEISRSTVYKAIKIVEEEKKLNIK